jgi:hypothetical protein
MRADMAKVIVERPRFGSRRRGKPKGYRRRLATDWLDGLPLCEGIRRRSGGLTKHLNEHLGPLKRFLLSRAGQPWDRVFSEICEHIDRSSAVQDHIRDHVEDFVALHVVLIDGVPCQRGGHDHGRPLTASWFREQLYVCPKTGLLRRVPPRRPRPRPRSHPGVRLDRDHVCAYLNGAWFLVRVRPFPLARSFFETRPVDSVIDPISRRPFGREQAMALYGDLVYGVSRRQLSRAEMRHLPIPVEWQR